LVNVQYQVFGGDLVVFAEIEKASRRTTKKLAARSASK